MTKQKMAGNYRSPTVIYRYIYSNLICLLFVNVRKNKVNDKTFKIKLYFDSYKSSTDCQRNKKCKNYIQLDQLKTIKRTKNGLKRNIKML